MKQKEWENPRDREELFNEEIQLQHAAMDEAGQEWMRGRGKKVPTLGVLVALGMLLAILGRILLGL